MHSQGWHQWDCSPCPEAKRHSPSNASKERRNHHKARLSEVEGLAHTSLARERERRQTASTTVPARIAFSDLCSMIYLSL